MKNLEPNVSPRPAWVALARVSNQIVEFKKQLWDTFYLMSTMQHLIVGLLLSGLVGYGVGTSDCSRPPRGTGPEWWLKCALQLGLDECDGKSMYTHSN